MPTIVVLSVCVSTPNWNLPPAALETFTSVSWNVPSVLRSTVAPGKAARICGIVEPMPDAAGLRAAAQGDGGDAPRGLAGEVDEPLERRLELGRARARARELAARPLRPQVAGVAERAERLAELHRADAGAAEGLRGGAGGAGAAGRGRGDPGGEEDGGGDEGGAGAHGANANRRRGRDGETSAAVRGRRPRRRRRSRPAGARPSRAAASGRAAPAAGRPTPRAGGRRRRTGRPWMPSAAPVRSSSRTSSAKRSPASSSSTSAAGSPTSPASRSSAAWSLMSSPSLWYARMRRSFIASCRPCAAARWMSRCASNVLPPRTRSKRKSSPSPAATPVSCAGARAPPRRTCPYLAASSSALGIPRSAGAAGSSSKLRHVTSTSSRCSKPASAVSKRRLPT